MLFGKICRPLEEHMAIGIEKNKQKRGNKSVFRVSGTTGFIKLVQALAGIFATVILARLLGPNNFGVYAFGLSVATILSIPLKNGFGELIVRELSSSEQSQNWSHVSGFIRWSVRLTIVYITGITLFLGGFVHIFSGRSPLAEATLIGLAMLPGFAFIGIAAGGVRAFGRPTLALLPDAVLRPLFFILILGIVFFFAPSIATNPLIAIAVHALSAAGCALGLWMLFLKDLPIEARDAIPARIDSWHWIKVAIAFSAVGSLMVLNRQVDLLILAAIAGAGEAGLYRVAVQGGMLITFGAQAINYVVSPLFARNRLPTDHHARVKLVRVSVLFSAGVAIPGVAIMVVFGEFLIGILFGQAFLAAYPALVILSVANAVAMLNGAIVPLLNMTGHERNTLGSFAAAVIINAVTAASIVPFLGLVGAAISALIATFVWSLLLRQASVRHLGIDPILTVLNRQSDV